VPVPTVCHEQLSFASLGPKEVVVGFDGGRITSDAGCVLLREIDLHTGLVDRLDRAMADPRDATKVVHPQVELLRQRIFAIVQGYEDANDHATLRSDPVLKAAVGRSPVSAADLASQPTLSRLENRVSRTQLRRLGKALLDAYLAAHPKHRDLVVIDIDSTDDPTHGHQQLSLFHGYFDQHMYHPLLVFDGVTGHPLATVLRPGNSHAARGAVDVLDRLLYRLRRAYPKATILVRADAGFAVPAVYELLERHQVRYVIGLLTNDRLRSRVADLSAAVEKDFETTHEKQRRFASFRHRADSWQRSRRVVAKVERLDKGLNTRFVVTNLAFEPAVFVYDGLYIGRGDMENRIKEWKNHLKADRTSCHGFGANQFRILLHTFAFVLLWHLRESLAGTELAQATFDTLRLKLLKIGARVSESCRRIVVSVASAYPYRALFASALATIQQMPAGP
jgi:hypothetical protein